MNLFDLANHKRRERHRNQRGDANSSLHFFDYAASLEKPRTDFLDRADEHPAGSGNRIVMLATSLYELLNMAFHPTGIGATSLFDLVKARRIDVERLDFDQQLVIVDGQ